MPDTLVRALLIDDEAIVREALGELLRRTGRFGWVGLCESAAAAHDALVTDEPDLVITDLVLGEGPDGIQLTKAIASRYPGLPVLLLSGYDEALFAEQAIEAGASGFVMKESPLEELLEAIDVILGGRIWVSATIRSQLQGPARSLAVLEAELGESLSEAIRSGNRSTIGLARQLGHSVPMIDEHIDATCRSLGLPGRAALFLQLSPPEDHHGT